MGRTKEKIDEKKLSSWKLLDDFRRRLAKVRAASAPPPEGRPGGPERLLLEEDYFSLMLFGLLNPVIDSMRGLCAASHLERVQKEVCGRKISLGSFSEAQSVFDPELLRQVFLDLSGEIHTLWGDARLAPLADRLKLVDGTLLPALPRMHWALWVNDTNRAAKLHLKFSVLRQAAAEAVITAGNCCERKALRQMLKPGEIIVGDRYYGLEYGFFGELRALGVSSVMRIRNEPCMEIVGELGLTDADRAAGVTWQGKEFSVQPGNLDELKKHAIVVCLWATPETVYERVKHQTDRPLLKVPDPVGRIRELLAQREPFYHQADVLLSTDRRSSRQLAQLIISEYRRLCADPPRS